MSKKINVNNTTLRILCLYRGDYSRAIYAQKIALAIDKNKDTATKLLKQLEQLRIFKSIKRGRNVDYQLNLDNVITRYYLELAEIFASINLLDDYFLIKKVTDELRDQTHGILILFGSFAKRLDRETSDIDLFVIGDEGIDIHVVQSVEDLIGREINIKHSTPAEFLSGLNAKSPLEHEVLSDHIVLKGADEFCDIVWKYYAET
jgi:predicted nucleotidyltransferase